MNTRQAEEAADELNETRVLLYDAVDLCNEGSEEAKTKVAHALAYVEDLLERFDDTVRDLHASSTGVAA